MDRDVRQRFFRPEAQEHGPVDPAHGQVRDDALEQRVREAAVIRQHEHFGNAFFLWQNGVPL